MEIDYYGIFALITMEHTRYICLFMRCNKSIAAILSSNGRREAEIII